MNVPQTHEAGIGYKEGRGAAFRSPCIAETKPLLRDGEFRSGRDQVVRSSVFAGSATTMWQSAQVPAEHWSYRAHTIPMVVARYQHDQQD